MVPPCDSLWNPTMTNSGRTSFLEESEKKRSEGKRIRDQGMLALVSCIRCSRASEKCWVGADSKKCAFCTENIMLCTVNPDKYRSLDNAEAVVAGTQPSRCVSPGQGSEEAERLHAVNPSCNVPEAKTKLSSPKPSAVKRSHRKRTGKRIRDKGRLALPPCLRRSRAAEYRRVGIRAKNCAYCTRKRIIISKDHTVVDENDCYEPIKPKIRPCRKGVSKPVNVLQETYLITPKRVKQEPKRAKIDEELEAASGSEYHPDQFNSGSESPPRIPVERKSVKSSDGGREEKEEEASPESSEDIAALRREIIELRRELKEMQKEFREGLEEILHARKPQALKRKTEIIDLEDVIDLEDG